MESGKGSLKNPHPSYDWHHNSEEFGLMELIHREHHKEKGSIQNVLHKDGKGGFKKWK